MVADPKEIIHPVRIQDEMQVSYLNYAMSVIVSRALPDVRDGLKPVQRRILYAMDELSLGPNTQYKKSARIVGEVLGKYHPHGDSPVYDALVRMAQDFSLRYPLVDGQGNFGSIDDDPPAAMRYTEARLPRIAQEMLEDLDLDTVDFATNFDDSLSEPKVLPAKLPNLLINGASGIAVGMATNTPPHNLTEICNAICYLIDNPNTSVDDLLKIVKGPDFPTKGIALVGKDKEFLSNLYSTGQGRVIMRSKISVEDLKGDRSSIVITELPYQVNKASLVAKIAQMTRDKKIEGISDIRDESDRDGMRVVVELKRGAHAQMVLNNLYKHTSMQSSFNVMMLALVDGQPQILTLKRALQLFVDHRVIIITRRSEFLLKKAKTRAHILEGLRIALEFLDKVIQLIRQADDVDSARKSLMAELNLTEPQSQAILDMQLRRLAALERQRLEDEYKNVINTIKDLEELLSAPGKIIGVVREETMKLKEDYPSPRLTEIVEEVPTQHTLEELTQPQEVVITLSRRDYIKRIPSDTYRSQLRGGKGVKGMTTREGDAVQHLTVADARDLLLLFTNKGRVYPLRCFEVPIDTSRVTRGNALVNMVKLNPGERVHEVVAVPQLDTNGRFVLGTRRGEVKGLRLRDLANLRSNGLIVMDVEKGDELVSVRKLEQEHDVVMITAGGQSIRFGGDRVPSRSRPAGGVRGIKLVGDDVVVGMETVDLKDRIMVVTEFGHGKLMAMSRYPKQGRGGMGVRAFNVTKKTGALVDSELVKEGVDNEVFIVSANSQVYRTKLDGIPTQGRHSSGVIVWRPDSGDKVASIACFQNEDKA